LRHSEKFDPRILVTVPLVLVVVKPVIIVLLFSSVVLGGSSRAYAMML
jgi:hypothetical protein